MGKAPKKPKPLKTFTFHTPLGTFDIAATTQKEAKELIMQLLDELEFHHQQIQQALLTYQATYSTTLH